MYKTVFIEHRQGGYQAQTGKTQQIEDTINKWYENGYELVSITPLPYPTDASRVNLMLVFKKFKNYSKIKR